MRLDRFELGSVIVAVTGHPGVGKSTLGRELARLTNLKHLDIDEQARDLEPVLGEPPVANWFVNSMRMMSKYALIHSRAADSLALGDPVLLTATYSHETYVHALRTVLGDTYRRFAKLEETPLRIFELDAPEESLALRIAERRRAGSNSDVLTLEHVMELRRRYIPIPGDDVIHINTGLPIQQNVEQILTALEPFRKTE